jgi:hypothetical protein
LTLVNAPPGQSAIMVKLHGAVPRWGEAIQFGTRPMAETISFRVVKEPYGWAVRMGQGMMMTPFRSRILALRHANGVAEALRQRGEPAEVVFEEVYPGEPEPAHRGRSRFGAL